MHDGEFGRGDLKSHVDFKETTMSHVSVAYFSPCHMLNV